MKTFIVIVALCVGFSMLPAQVEMTEHRGSTSIPTVFVDLEAFLSDVPGKSRVDMYIQMPFDEIKFVKEGEQYTGKFEIAATINNADKEHVWDKDVLVEVRTKEFSHTTANRLYSLRQLSADLLPGNYEVIINVEDQESKKSFKTRRNILVTDFSKDSISLSDMMLVNKLTTSGNKKSIVPNIAGMITDQSLGFYLFFEAYSRARLDSLEFAYSIFDSKKKKLLERHSIQHLSGDRTQIFLKVDSLNIPVGVYFIQVDALDRRRDIKEKPVPLASTSRTFSIRWSDIPFTITDIDKAIDQMRYIAKPSDMDYIRDGATPEEKRQRFLEFWNKRDPDPQTPRNELMEEYYTRVDYSNQMFGTYYEGWKTDRGMVYIRYGPPDNVDRHPFETSTRPYEIWYYYQLDRVFQFVDETGFGDYRLVYPTTDMWGRIR